MFSNTPTSPNSAVMSSAPRSGIQSGQSGNSYSGSGSHNSSSIGNGSTVPSSQSVQQMCQVMGSGPGPGINGVGTNTMGCVAHSQSAHQLGIHQQLQQRFAAAAASAVAPSDYGKNDLKRILTKQSNARITSNAKVKPFYSTREWTLRMPRQRSYFMKL